MRSTTFFTAALVATAQAAKDERTFAVLHFYGDGPLMEGRVDPIISPGTTSSHVHTFQGGSNIGISATGEDLMKSECSTANIEGDNSAYWMPKAYFRDPSTGHLEDVELYYMNVYYFFEPTDDDVVAFPVGLQMISGNASLRECPDFGGESVLDAGSSTGVQPLQWTCPRQNYDLAGWPSASQSDGTKAGIEDPNNQGAGQGFPFAECDGTYSPLRHDLHFPSCYDPSKDLTDYANNMAFPTTDKSTGKQNCPTGWTHVPHIFYEMYWDTPAFTGRWTPNQGYQPFLLANGDLSGCSGHGDFMAAWDVSTLQNIIDNCNAGDSGMDKCPGVTPRDQTTSCNVASPIDEVITGNLTALPGNNPLAGWGMSYGGSGAVSGGPTGASSTASATAHSSATSSAAASAYPVSPSEVGGDSGSDTTTESVSSTASSSAVAQITTSPAAVENVAPASSTATTLSTEQKCVHRTVTVKADAVTVTVTVEAADRSAEPAKRENHAHAHAHAHVGRYQSPHHRH